MKKIRNLDQPVIGFGGEPITDMKGKPVLVKPLLLQYFSAHISPSKEDVFLAMKVGAKIFDAKSDVELEDTEFAFVEKILDPPQHSAVIMMSLYKALEQAG